MPGFDRSGPQGMGPRTGGARGACNPAAAGYGAASGRGMGYGRGFRNGFGRGRGLRQGITGGTTLYPPAAPMDQTAELDMLKADAMSMKYGLEMIKRRIDELEKSGS
jgi:hypothetical protein